MFNLLLLASKEIFSVQFAHRTILSVNSFIS